MIQIDANQLKGLSLKLKKIQGAIDTITTDPSFQKSVGQLLVTRGKTNLEQGGAGNKSYALLAPSTRRAKARRGQSMKPLQGNGHLKRSLNAQPGAPNLRLSAAQYAVHHQYGAPKGNLPKREIYTLEREDKLDIQDFLVRRFKQKAGL